MNKQIKVKSFTCYNIADISMVEDTVNEFTSSHEVLNIKINTVVHPQYKDYIIIFTVIYEEANNE